MSFFVVLDFFPELRDDNKPFWSEFEDAPEEKYDSMDEDMQEGEYEDYDAAIGPDDAEYPSLPHYEISTSQTSMYQTPRQGMSSTSRQQPPTRKHADGRIYSYPDGMLKKHHHHHHHHRHHHHHSSNTSRSNVTTSRASRTTILRPDQSSSSRSRNASNTGSAISSVLVGGEEEENVDDLFAYDAGIHAGPSTSTYHPQEVYDNTSNTIHQEGTEQYQDEWHPKATFAHPGLIDEQNYQVKSETPDVKAEEEDPDETYM